MKTRLIFNPVSGHNRKDPWLLDVLRERVASNTDELSLRLTEGPGHATTLANEAVADGCERVIAVGGDGTMNEVAQALVGGKATLGLVPCGSGNGLALHLGIPLNPRSALELSMSLDARERRIDTGEADGHLFCNAMGLGLDAEISERFNKLQRRGLPNYIRTTISALRQHEPLSVTVLSDSGEQFRTEVTVLAVANSDQYGNKAYIAPGALIDDGKLDLTAIKPIGLLKAVPLAWRLFRGTLGQSPLVRCVRSAAFTLHRPHIGPIHTDGETHQAGTRIRVEARPASLRILVPTNSLPPKLQSKS